MSDYFSAVEPMDIEGEAVCAICPQLVTAEGEKGAGVDVKRTSSHLEANNLLTLDNGEPTDDQEQVTASAHDKFAKTALVFRSKLDQMSKLQGKGAMGEPAAEGGVQDVRGGNKSTNKRAIHTNNDVFVEGVRVPGPSLVPYLLAPHAFALWSYTGQNYLSPTCDSCSPSIVLSTNHHGSFCRRQG